MHDTPSLQMQNPFLHPHSTYPPDNKTFQHSPDAPHFPDPCFHLRHYPLHHLLFSLYKRRPLPTQHTSFIIFSMFCIEQAKIYWEPKFRERQSVWWLDYRETKMSNTCLINTGAPCWCTTLVHQHGGPKTLRPELIKPNFNRNGQI